MSQAMNAVIDNISWAEVSATQDALAGHLQGTQQSPSVISVP